MDRWARSPRTCLKAAAGSSKLNSKAWGCRWESAGAGRGQSLCSALPPARLFSRLPSPPGPYTEPWRVRPVDGAEVLCW